MRLGTTFAIEPANPASGGRPDLVVDAAGRQWLFEIKCRSFVKHQEQRGLAANTIRCVAPRCRRRDPLGRDPAGDNARNN